MWHNLTLIGGVWIVAAIAAWLLCRWRGYSVATWAVPLAISAFCLGLFVGAENTTKGRFKVPLLSLHHAHRHLGHHTASR
jgi:hypothetical protein